MKSQAVSILLTFLALPFAHTAATPELSSFDSSSSDPVSGHVSRVIDSVEARDASIVLPLSPPESENELWKRRGGGGSGSRGGGGSSSGGRSGGSSSSGSRGGSSSSSRGGSSSSGRGGSSSSSSSGSSSSSRGGSSSSSSSSRTGTSSPRTFGGGRYYSGGSTTPYSAGAASAAGLTGVLFGLALLSFWPGIWYHPAYLYHYPDDYRYNFHNDTSSNNESLPVLCACVEGQMCGCDENNSTDYLNSLVGNGSYAGLNQSVVSVAEVNGTKTLLINGTLPVDEEDSMASFVLPQGLVGYWPVVLASLAAAYVL
ncbi:hypothetical protein TD95_000087 [Thielaviopsis punctulata]|uniref:DUF7732 domain-containing protein n=1 Tax=Thielaviopsis punctulata TaxID=72032 RepID=A0A0F4Z704_9PEZI|nr:hypothetical protein TD95_000087 [Thielaviopsis punctulata]